jgi:hypothetical protein
MAYGFTCMGRSTWARTLAAANPYSKVCSFLTRQYAKTVVQATFFATVNGSLFRRHMRL